MPKPTFFRLPEEKRMRLVKAAYAEFTRAPFADASISNIIKDAGIPRGSFYQYFEDKGDIFFYLLDRMRESTTAALQGMLAKHNGDLFPSVTDLFDMIINELADGPYAAFYQNVFMYMDFHSAAKISPGVDANAHKPKGHEVIDYMMNNVDRRNLRVDSDRQLRMLIRQVVGMFMQTVGSYYNHLGKGETVNAQELKKRVAQLLDWLQYGAVKEAPHD